MKHVIIGTAGHIDHGKTTLIKALTGRDTDTLKEEKDRGISINLGFTYFDLPSGKRAGIVDVPGHEKFIKNMLAGVSGIDVVLLVIAADEGIMPQTKEHLNILSLLDVKKGIVVVTKKDLVDTEWLEVVIEDIKNYLKGTFLEEAEIIPVSSVTGEGLKRLVESIDFLTENVIERNTDGFFRLPVDRVFTISGFGTVVTGTLISGTISEGEKVMIYPSLKETKARNIEVHEQPVKTAFAGQRVAMNLSNIGVDEIKRGDVLAKPECIEPSMMIDCRLVYLKDAPRPLKNRDRVRIYHGTAELFGRVIILDKEEVPPGDKCFLQIRLESPISAMIGDKYVIRSYSPMVTIGGGTILDPNPPKRKRFDEKAINELKVREKGDIYDILEQLLIKNSMFFPSADMLLKSSGINDFDIKKVLNEMTLNGKAVRFDTNDGIYFCHIDFVNFIKAKLREYLLQFHSKNPLKFGASKEEIKSRLFERSVKQKIFDDFLELIKQQNIIKINGKYVSINEHEVTLTPSQEMIRNKIMENYKGIKFDGPKPNELFSYIKENESNVKEVFEYLTEKGEIIKINEDFAISKESYDYALNMLKEYISENKEITLAKYRDLLNTGRKVAVSLLEYFDQNKITKRIEDKRILY